MLGVGQIGSAIGRIGIATPLKGGGGGASYLGQVATRSNIMTRRTGATSMRGRLRMTMREDVTSFQLVLPNWFVQDFVDLTTTYLEQGPGGSMTVRAAIEYPEGVFTQVTFSGLTSATIADGGQVVSDPVALSIPAGTDWFFRFYNTATGGMPFTGGGVLTKTAAAIGDFFEVNIATDNTMGGAYSGNAQIGNMYAPLAVIGQTTKRSFLLIGDSICAGEYDAAAADMGIIARSIGPVYAYSNFGIRGDSAFRFTQSGNNSKRMALAQYFSDIICQTGINDVGINGRTGAQASTDLAAEWVVLKASGKRLYQATITPSSTSSDGWATVANQALKAWESNRITLQNFIRAGNANVNGIVEIADSVESARNSGRWKAPPQHTIDGTHPTPAGYLLPGSAGAVTSAIAL